MLVARFCTTDIPEKLRFAAWHEMTRTALISTAVTADSVDNFTASVDLIDLGAAQLSTISYPPLRAARSARQIRQSDPDLYYLVIPARGALAVRQADRSAAVRSGQFALIDTSLPGVVANIRAVEQLIIQVPRSEVPIRTPALRTALARSLPAGAGLGALMVTMARQIMQSANEYDPVDGKRLASIVVDLVVSVLAQSVREDSAARDAGQRLLQLRILDFIEKHLPQPDLTPARIAAAHNVSVRYLQVLFSQQGLTVAGWIRKRRLDRCRRDLRDSAFARRSVYAVGARWGFPDATGFSRTFKQAFGVPPGEYRNQHVQAQECADGQGLCAECQLASPPGRPSSS